MFGLIVVGLLIAGMLYLFEVRLHGPCPRVEHELVSECPGSGCTRLEDTEFLGKLLPLLLGGLGIAAIFGNPGVGAGLIILAAGLYIGFGRRSGF